MFDIRGFGVVDVYCDKCDYLETIDTDCVEGYADFSYLTKELKADGWKITKENDEWIHKCSDCQEEQ